MPTELADLQGLQTDPMVDYADLVTAAQLLAAGRTGIATYEVSVRRLPDHRPYLVNAGVEHVLDYLERFQLCADELDLLRQSAPGIGLPEDCHALLEELRFTGTVEAMPEGTVFFAGEPILRLRGPAHELALVRHAVLCLVRDAVRVASHVSRLNQAAAGKPLTEVCGHRPSGRTAALMASRAAYVGGIGATTNLDAAHSFGIPTAAVLEAGMLFFGADQDEAADRLDAMGGRVTVLLDRHQPRECLQRLLDLGHPLQAVALTDADPAATAPAVRSLLDEAGWNDTRVLAAVDRSESDLGFLADADVPVDGLLVDLHGGAVSRGGPLTLCNDLVEWQDEDGTRTPVLPPDLHGIVPQGARTVYRQRGIGCYQQDTVQPDGTEPPSRAVSLLVPVMEEGGRLFRSPSLGEVRALCVSQVQMLPEQVVRLEDFEPYLVEFPYEECQLLEAEETGPEAEEIAEAPDEVQDLLSSLDDSADFTFVSNMEDMVARGLGVEPVEALPEAEAAADPATGDAAASDDADGDREADEALLESEDREDEDASEESEDDSAATADAPGDEAPAAAAGGEAAVEPTPVEEPAEESAPGGKTKKKRKKKGKKRPESAGDSPADQASVADTPAKTMDPVAAAAARLKALKGGGGGSMPAPSMPAAAASSASPEPTDSTPAAPPAEEMEHKTSADPLAAAAARLKALKNGGAPPPAATPSAKAGGATDELTEVQEVAPVKEKGDKLASAADRLKALRNGG